MPQPIQFTSPSTRISIGDLSSTELEGRNASPFELILCILDEPMPKNPVGGDPKETYILTSEAFDAKKATMIGKPARMTAIPGAHDEPNGDAGKPLGVVTEAWRQVIDAKRAEELNLPKAGNYACVKGIFWDADAPLQMGYIRKFMGEIGASYEMLHAQNGILFKADENGDVFFGQNGNDFEFSGLAILPRTTAAYQEFTTMLAASTSQEIDAVFSGPDDKKLPEPIKMSATKVRDIFVGAWNGAYEAYKKENDTRFNPDIPEKNNRERYAFATAYSQLTKSGYKSQDGKYVEAATYPGVSNPSMEERRTEQRVRSKKYGIAINENGHVTMPMNLREMGLTEEDMADPVNMSYPAMLNHDKLNDEQMGMLRNAPARFAQFGDSYDPESRQKVASRIQQALKKHGVGDYKSASVSFSEKLQQMLDSFRSLFSSADVNSPDAVSASIGGGETTMTPEEMQQKMDEMQRKMEDMNAMMASINSQLDAERVKASTLETSQIDLLTRFATSVGIKLDPGQQLPDTDSLIGAVSAAREILCGLATPELKDATLQDLATHFKQSAETAEAQKLAASAFDPEKGKYLPEKHERCLQIFALMQQGKSTLVDFQELQGYLAPVTPPAGGRTLSTSTTDTGNSDESIEATIEAMAKHIPAMQVNMNVTV